MLVALSFHERGKSGMFLTVSPPNAPTDLTLVAVSDAQIDLSWTDNTTGTHEETGFEVWRSDDSGVTYSLITTTAADATSYSDTGLTVNTIYYYKVRAVVSPINSDFTAPANMTTPTAVSGFYLSVISDTQIDLHWSDYSPDETGFEIKRSDDGGSTYSVIHTTAADATSYSNTGLTGNKEYFYTVRALDSIVSPASDPVSAATALAGPLYVQFKVKLGADEIAAAPQNEFVYLRAESGFAASLSYNYGLSSWVYAIGGESGVYAGAPPVADTYNTIDLKLDYTSTPGSTILTAKFDGTAADPLTVGYVVAGRQLWLGALVSNVTGLINRTFDDVKFGNSGYASTDFLTADFASTIVPPFDLTDGSTVEITSTAMHVHNAGGLVARAYARFDVPTV